MSGNIFAEGPDGLELVGAWDDEYRATPDPWGQSASHGQMAAYYRRSRAGLIEALRGCRSAIEIGCGHGHLTARLNAELPGQVVGVDISGEAIAQARVLHPECDFVVGDILAPPHPMTGLFDVAIWGQCWWYLLHDLDLAMANTLCLIERGGLFVISQAFLRGEQRYAAEIAKGFEGALRLLLGRYPGLRLVTARLDETTEVHDDGLLIFRVP